MKLFRICSLASALSISTITHSAPLMRIFELTTAPSQQQAFFDVGIENLTRSIETEQGTLAMYVVRSKDEANLNYVVEIYQDQNAYQIHVNSPQFKKFVEVAKTAVIGRKVFEIEPQILIEKPIALRKIADNTLKIHVVELTVKPEFNEKFRHIVMNKMQQTMAKEEGAWVMYAGTLKGQPNQWRFFEVYTNQQSYQFHRNTAYFKSYIEQTQAMLNNKRLIELHADIVMNKGLKYSF